jgi:hypothetical protein
MLGNAGLAGLANAGSPEDAAKMFQGCVRNCSVISCACCVFLSIINVLVFESSESPDHFFPDDDG